MRILMSVDTAGDVWAYSLDLIEGLNNFGVEVVLATMGSRLSREQRHAVARIRDLEVVESDYRSEWMDQPWKDIREAGHWLLRLEDSFHPDVLHFNHYAHGSVPFVTPKIVVGHSCVYSWWRAVHRSDPPQEWLHYYREVQAGLDSADQVITPSESMLSDLRRIYRAVLPDARVIPNGTRADRSTRRDKESMILAVGRLWDETKDLDGLDWPLYVPRDDLEKYYARAAIFAHPARYEPFGLRVLEAAASGCALVLGDIASLRENWDGAALFVSPDDPDDLLETLKFLVRSRSDCELLGERARLRAQTFSMERMAHAYHEEYKRLAGRMRGAKNMTLGKNCFANLSLLT